MSSLYVLDTFNTDFSLHLSYIISVQNISPYYLFLQGFEMGRRLIKRILWKIRKFESHAYFENSIIIETTLKISRIYRKR